MLISESSLRFQPGTKKLAALSGTVDVKLVTQIKDLQEANERIQSRFDKLQEQCKAAMAEGAQLKEQRAQLEKQLTDSRRDLENLRSSNTSAQQTEIDALRVRSINLALTGCLLC